jgi:hypothetical protein
MLEGGSLGLGRLLDASAVDFVAFVEGEGGYAPIASVEAHGKQWIGIAGTEAAAELVVLGADGVVAPAHDDAGLRDAEQALRTRPDDAGKVTPSQVAVVVDSSGAAYLGADGTLARKLIAAQIEELVEAGIGFRTYELADLIEREFPKERVIIFLNAFVLDEKQRELLATLRSGGRELVFVYAAGAMRPDRGVDGRDIRDFTGIGVTMLPKDRPLRIAVTGGLEPWTGEVGEGVVYGTAEKVSPGFCVVDGEAEVLGTIQGLKMPGLVAKKFDGWTSVYSAAPGIPAALLRGLVKAAGVEPYTDRPVWMVARHGLIAIGGDGKGPVALRFPKAVKVSVVAGEAKVSPEGVAGEFAVDVARGERAVLAVKAE